MMKIESGAKIDNYELLEHVGVGSSGEIWKAMGAGGQIVAIKFMRENLISSRSATKHRERLEREVNALKTLNHPNIPAIYEWDLESERPYFVMEFIDSPSLDKLILRGELVKQNIRKRLTIIKNVASALSLAHKNDIIHRDIKPGNINGVDKPYLMDFSISLAAENRDMTNFNIGTSIYMPPDFEAPDAIGDAWSFAVVAYEILFGRHPIFDYDDPIIKKGMYARFAAKKRLDDGEWVKPTTIEDPQMPDDLKLADLEQLDAIFTKALGARDVRYTDLTQFAEDIENAIFISQNTVATAADVEVAPMPDSAEDGAVGTLEAQAAPTGITTAAYSPTGQVVSNPASMLVLAFGVAMAIAVTLSIVLLAIAEFTNR
ncbi:MAG: serine/threonine-protein kinase [Anaerolineae bacterium]|nr:serine/threonine-protein kinase [Anaerolineae bacterium]MDQ7037244.1 serine/threonine-protein kinase [Anaerolineae bacterium]